MGMRRAIRIVAIGFAALTGAVAIALLALLGAAQTDFGRQHAARLLETILAGPGETVRIGTLEGSLPVHVRARDIALADGRGTWLALDELRFDWSIAPCSIDCVTSDRISSAVCGIPWCVPPCTSTPVSRSSQFDAEFSTQIKG